MATVPPVLEPGIFDHLVFLALVLYLPLDGHRRFRALRSAVAQGQPDARMRAYRRVLLEEWILAGAILVGWSALDRDPEVLGLVPVWSTWALVGYGITALAIGLLLVQSRSIAGSETRRRDLRKALGALAALTPQTLSERRAFASVSVTAGICEEVMFRGFLFAYLAAWMPGQHKWVVVLLGGILFGLAHLYQGRLGIVKTGFVGVLLGGLYWLTDSLWSPMLLHAAIDLSSGWMSSRVLEDEIDDAEPTAATASAG